MDDNGLFDDLQEKQQRLQAEAEAKRKAEAEREVASRAKRHRNQQAGFNHFSPVVESILQELGNTFYPSDDLTISKENSTWRIGETTVKLAYDSSSGKPETFFCRKGYSKLAANATRNDLVTALRTLHDPSPDAISKYRSKQKMRENAKDDALLTAGGIGLLLFLFGGWGPLIAGLIFIGFILAGTELGGGGACLVVMLAVGLSFYGIFSLVRRR